MERKRGRKGERKGGINKEIKEMKQRYREKERLRDGERKDGINIEIEK